MHEWLITRERLEQACNEARSGGISHIRQIEVRLGRDSRLTEEAWRSCFDLLKEGAMAKEAALKVNNDSGSSLLLVSLQGEAENDRDQEPSLK